MFKRFYLWSVILLFAVAPLRAEVTISAAISLKAPLEKARPILEKAAGEKIDFTYGASGTLAAQIREGAPVDIFLSADQANVTKLQSEKLLDNATIATLAGNELVLVVPKDATGSIRSFADLAASGVRHIAIGEPTVVPACAYAKQTLTQFKLYDSLEKAGKLMTAENVAQVLALVNRSEVDAGLVYRTDTLNAKNVTIVAEAPENSHTPIVYVMAVPASAGHAAAAKLVETALLGKDCQAVFAAAGFKPPPAPVAALQPSATAPSH